MTEVNEQTESKLDFDFSLDDVASEGTQAGENTGQDAIMREKQRHLSLFSRIPVTLTLEVASVEISLAELINVNNDSVLELDKMAGEPLDVKVNGILLGKAEVVVINDKYGLRIIEFNNKELSELAR
ncbi:flagellar motor switch protein FliN [Pantoea agglomerans]|uniref:Flagellar motor switch protein FliN n=1 Tax=Enterobacter agglomerans TaxID=549 RepID=A0ACC5RJA3_ENTAG|nr:flagellar motor switch protein FliN [Pantoea agglomerans]MBK4724652.1 flagellar motor switch protein FliN [Pantoea agglomerans]